MLSNVQTYLVLLLSLLRYRIAVMLFLFYLLSVSFSQNNIYTLDTLLILIALCLSYVSATSINDLSDKEVDSVNHKNNPARLYANKKVTKKDMILVHIFSSSAVLCIGAHFGGYVFLIFAASLIINYLYSLPPFRISYRTYFAHTLLAIAYVALPFMLGQVVGGKSEYSVNTMYFGLSLFFLFFGRIFLKDFRDRAGDRKYHKPTFILRYGKSATILFSLSCVILGNMLLIFSLFRFGVFLIQLIPVQILFLFVYKSFLNLRATKYYSEELKFIGMGAKMGNGILILVLGILLMLQNQASSESVLLFGLSLSAIYSYTFWKMLGSSYNFLSYKG